ncbi:hypothetical protein MN116_007825 [Schistosoma mekongi]|uniref:PH domain-containing protein n=1 Tax=Schistosoma mekongi TaxID=38744 RepID=A0AAE2D251_SCHME|nr:hypothetical protein MN116_007825 [Schistosoma mekongi]
MPSKIRIVLEGYARYRDGKKWKKRYCVLSLSPTTPDALHLYITKSYDDFAAYRNSGSVLTAMLPAVRKLHELPISPESRSLLGEFTGIQKPSDHNHNSSLHQNTLTSQSSSSTTSSGPLVDTAVHSYNAASGCTSSGLATASNLASSVGGPAPVDEITGFESGYHMDKESNIIVFIGVSSAYALALAGMDEMFRWADTLARIVVDNRFRVTLRHAGDGSKLFQGLQGSLHVQHWRLCLIGEPSTGCKFICNWRLDHVDKAYTMTIPAQNANQFFPNICSSSTSNNNCPVGMNNNNSATYVSASLTASTSPISFSSFNASNPLNLDTHRTPGSRGSTTVSTTPGAATSGSTLNNNPNKYLFFMECSPASGKGRGSYIFEIDGSRLVELTIAIEQFTALRYNPNLKPATSAEASQLTVAAQSTLGTGSFGPVDCCNSFFRNNNPAMCGVGGNTIDDLGVASSFSSDTSSNPRSVSPTHQSHQQHQLTKRRSRDSIFNPLRKISSGHHNFNIFKATHDYQSFTIDRLPIKQTTMSQLNSTTTTTTTAVGQSSVPVLNSRFPSGWNFQRTSSLSPPDMVANDPMSSDNYHASSLSRSDRLNERFNIVGVVSTTVTGGGRVTATMSSSTQESDEANILSSSSTTSLIGHDLIDNISDTNYFLDDNIQVAKVAAGLIISRKPPYYHQHHNTTTRVPGFTPASTMFAGVPNMNNIITTTTTIGVVTGIYKQTPALPLPQFNVFSTTPSSRLPPHQHQHTHHHRQIFDAGNNNSNYQSSGGCCTTAVLPSVPIPSIGTDSGINVHNIMQNSSSSCSSEHNNRIQFYAESLPKQKRYHHYQRQYHNSSSNLVSSCQISDSLHTSSSELNCFATASSSVESTLDQVDNTQDTHITDENITINATTSISTTTIYVTGVLNSSNHEIFTADEDYWDLRDNCNTQYKSSVQSSKMNAIDGDSFLSKKSDNLCVTTNTVLSAAPESHTYTESSTSDSYELNKLHNNTFVYPHFYLTPIEPEQCTYRHRLQQYRICICASLFRRSFSANSNIQFIGLANNPQDDCHSSLTLRPIRSLDSCVVSHTNTTTTSSYNDCNLAGNTSDEHDSNLCRTSRLLSNHSNIYVHCPPVYKSPCSGGRLQEIYRSLHRNRSQSHDNLQSGKFTINRSGFLHDLNVHIHANDKMSSKKFLRTHLPSLNCKDVSWRIVICPRHGIQSFDWNFSNQQNIPQLNNTCVDNRNNFLQLKKLSKSTFVSQKHSSKLSTLQFHSSNPFVLSLPPYLTEKSKYCHFRKSSEYLTRNNESKFINLQNFNEDNTSDSISNSHILSESKVPSSPLHSPITSSTMTSQLYTHSPVCNYNHYFCYAPTSSDKSQSLLSLFCRLNYDDLILSTRKLSLPGNNNILPQTTSRSKSNSYSFIRKQLKESLISSLKDDKAMQKSCHSEINDPVLSIDSKCHPLFSCNNNGNEKSPGSLSAYCDVEFVDELRSHLSLINSHNADNLVGSCHQEKLSFDNSNYKTCVRDVRHINVSDILQLSPLINKVGRRAQSLSSSSLSSSGGKATSATNGDNTWSKEIPYTTSSVINSNNDKSFASSNRQSYMSKLFDHSASSSVKPLSSSLITSTTIRANTLPTTSILRKQSNEKNTWNHSGNNPMYHSFVNSKITVPNQVVGTNQIATRLQPDINLVRNHLIPHRPDLRNPTSPVVQDITNNTITDKMDICLTRKFSDYSQGDHFSRLIYTNTSNNRWRKKSNGEIDDEKSTTVCSDQSTLEYPIYNNLIELRDNNPRSASSSGVAHGLTSIPPLVTPPTSTSETMQQSGWSSLSPQFLHLTINEDDGIPHQQQQHHSQSSAASYVNLPMFWSNQQSTTTTIPSSAFSRLTSNQEKQQPTLDKTIEPRLYANMVVSNTSKYHQLIKNKQQSKINFSILSKNRICHNAASPNFNNNLLISTGESQTPFDVMNNSLEPVSLNNFIPTAISTITTSTPQCCPLAARVRVAASLPSDSEYPNLPAEVRDPSRNYAMVDLRPSPASSAIPPTELTLNLIQHHHNDRTTGQLSSSTVGSCGGGSSSSSSSSNSGIGLNNSTSTGSDCTSDTATLTSDTMESCAIVGANNNNSYNGKANKLKIKNSVDTTESSCSGACGSTLMNISSSRRRHSHSLSSVVTASTTDPPILNYIHVIAASNSRFTFTVADQSSGPSSVNDSNRLIISDDFGDDNSPSSSNSSSGLGGGGVTSQSTASSSLATAPASSTSFGDIFSCRSMTSSGTSSVEGGNGNVLPSEVELSGSCCSPDDGCVTYTQIDFARTMALGELSNDMMAQDSQNLVKLPAVSGTRNITNRWNSSSSNPSKIDRATSVKKTLCRSIRLIGRGSRKKVG